MQDEGRFGPWRRTQELLFAETLQPWPRADAQPPSPTDRRRLPPVDTWVIIPGQCRRIPSSTRAKRSGAKVGVSSSLRTSLTVTGSAGLSFLLGRDPVRVTEMMQG